MQPIAKDAHPPKLLTRERIQDLQKSMTGIRCDMPEAEHFFAPGMYGRKFTMPAGMLVVGKIHKHQHLMMVLTGSAQIITDSSNELVSSGHVSVSPAGAKRVVYAFEQTTFVTVHHNVDDSQDLAKIETDHIEDEGFLSEYLTAIPEYLV
jgi:mannose-6-phosphate isomerase-like protein (cupin superfamily)